MNAEPSAVPAVSIMPESAEVGPQREVAEFGISVSDPGLYAFTLHGSADLAATLLDQDSMTVSAFEDESGANPLRLEARLAPGAYTLRARAARKGAPATLRVTVAPA